MFCSQCGNQMDDKAKFCAYCGTPNTPTGDIAGAEPNATPAPAASNGNESAMPQGAGSMGSAMPASQVRNEVAGNVGAAMNTATAAVKSGASKLSGRWAAMSRKQRSLTAAIAAAVVVVLIAVCGIAAGSAKSEPTGMWQSWAYSDGKRDKDVKMQVTVDGKGNITAIVDDVSLAGTITKERQQGGQNGQNGLNGSAKNPNDIYTVSNVAMGGELFDQDVMPTITLSIPKKGFVGSWSASFDFMSNSFYYSVETQKNGMLSVYVNSNEKDEDDDYDSDDYRLSGSWRQTGSDKTTVSYDVTIDDNTYAITIPKAYKS